MKFTIDRSRWRNGGPHLDKVWGPTRLLNEQGYMCCFGFLGQALGAPLEALKNIPYPHHESVRKYYPDWVVDKEWRFDPKVCWSTATRRLITINDGTFNTHKEREGALVDEFKLYNIEVEFVGEYQKIPGRIKNGKKEA